MNCLIVDDEPLAIDVIESFVNQVTSLVVVAKCNNAIDAIDILKKLKIDLGFLDIEMPKLTGIDLIKTVSNMPQFIFTTAYPQFALDAFELNATDYLVKPIPFHRFLKAVSKAKEKHSRSISLENMSSAGSNVIINTKDQFIFVKSEHENIKIDTNNIVYIQGLKDYIKIHLSNSKKSILTLMNFKSILEKLPRNFIRTHRSYIINVNYIDSHQKNKLIVTNERMPIGDNYRKELMQFLGI